MFRTSLPCVKGAPSIPIRLANIAGALWHVNWLRLPTVLCLTCSFFVIPKHELSWKQRLLFRFTSLNYFYNYFIPIIFQKCKSMDERNELQNSNSLTICHNQSGRCSPNGNLAIVHNEAIDNCNPL